MHWRQHRRQRSLTLPPFPFSISFFFPFIVLAESLPGECNEACFRLLLRLRLRLRLRFPADIFLRFLVYFALALGACAVFLSRLPFLFLLRLRLRLHLRLLLHLRLRLRLLLCLVLLLTSSSG